MQKTTGSSFPARQRLVAYHEAGHAVMGALTKGFDTVTKVAIQPGPKPCRTDPPSRTIPHDLAIPHDPARSRHPARGVVTLAWVADANPACEILRARSCVLDPVC